MPTMDTTVSSLQIDDNSITKTASSRRVIRPEPIPFVPPDRESFYQDLFNFHEIRNTPICRLPKINGREVDLYNLYIEVTSRGGWLKVNNRSDWEELIPILNLKEKCVNASVALKHVYIRFLDKYEKLRFLNEDPDKVEEPDDDGRPPRKWSLKPNYSIPATYNSSQHNLTEQTRIQHKLSTDLYKQSEYEKLLLSLVSPLPNEQDFAINVCTLMANEAKDTLKITCCPKLLDALIAHAGVYCHYSMRELFFELYTKIRKHSLQSFWNDCLHEKPQLLELSYDDYLQSANEKFIDSNVFRPPITLARKSLLQSTDDSSMNIDDVQMDLNNNKFLSLGRSLGTQDYVGQRVQQIVSIIRNLSFFEDNLELLASNRTFIRFVVLCMNIRWGNIHHMMFDVCGNIANELELVDPAVDDLTRSLVTTLCEGITGEDRGVIINCLEILYKLCTKESNRQHLCKCLNQELFARMCQYLTLNDIMLILYTLECVYALSSLGPRACNTIMQVRGVVGTLVSLLTVEAQSYGPDGCILMRVVETVPGNMLPMVAQNIANIANLQNAAMQIQHHQQHFNQDHTTDLQKSSPIRAPQPPHTPDAKKMKSNSDQFTQEHELFALSWLRATFEQSPSPESRIEQQMLYKMYLSATQKANRCGIVTHQHFPNLVRSIFGSEVGPNLIKATDSKDSDPNGFYYVCLRARANPLPIQIPKPGSATPIKTEIMTTPRKLNSAKKPKKKMKLKEELTIPKAEIKEDSQDGSVKLEDAEMKGSVFFAPNNENNQSSTFAPIMPSTSSVVVKQIQPPQATTTKQIIGNVIISHTPAPAQTTQLGQQVQVTTTTNGAGQQSTPSALIKSLLANKVTQRQQKQKEMAKQLQQQPSQQNTPAPANPSKLSTSISALVTNTLLQSNQVKVGQTTIKSVNVAAKPTTDISSENSDNSNWDPVPPLAPLSGGAVVRSIIVPSVANTDDSSSASIASSVLSSTQINDDGSIISFEGLLAPRSSSSTEDESSRELPKSSHVINANQMLVTLLDKKSPDPPIGTTLKRRTDEEVTEVEIKKMAMGEPATPVTPSKNAANLYAEMAASILEDEDLEEIIMPDTVPKPQVVTVQRQIIVNSNPQQQVIVTQQPNNQQPMQSIKPVEQSMQNIQNMPMIIQNQVSTIPQQMMQPVMQQQPQLQQTQYVLATNPQGKTFLVAQQPQPQPQTQTVYLTQTPQPGNPTKTIIFVQQQGGLSQPHMITAPPAAQPQKMIMTTPQGQQMIVTTQVPVQRPIQHQLIMNPTNTVQQQPAPQPQIITQLPHIPATIKLHQTGVPPPGAIIQTQPAQPATIQKISAGKPTVSIVPSQTVPAFTAPSIVEQSNAVVKPTLVPQSQPKASIRTPLLVQQSPLKKVQQNPALSIQRNQSVIIQQNPTQPAQTSNQPSVTAVAKPNPPQTAVAPTPAMESTSAVPVASIVPPAPILKPPQPTPTPNTSLTVSAAAPSLPVLPPPPVPALSKPAEDAVDVNWLFVCDWRNCPRKKFKSLNDVYRHACLAHCPEHLDPGAEIYCQWGHGTATLCDGVPRKRFSLMTHLLDRHCTMESFQATVNRNLANGIPPTPTTAPVTIIKNQSSSASSETRGTASPALSTSSSSSLPSAASAAMQAIKRHSTDFINPKELMDENEGPVTKSIRLTAALILRNLVTHTAAAKKHLRQYEPHLAGVALSNVESSGTISQILYELNN